MSDESILPGEVEAGERHYPEYTKGCWGSPGHRLCWLCKLRAPVKFLRLLAR